MIHAVYRSHESKAGAQTAKLREFGSYGGVAPSAAAKPIPAPTTLLPVDPVKRDVLPAHQIREPTE